MWQQMLLHILLQGINIYTSRPHKSNNLKMLLASFSCYNSHFADKGLQGNLNFLKFHTTTSNLHLSVDASKHLQLMILPSAQVAGSVQQTQFGMFHETLGRQIWLLPITWGHYATEANLSFITLNHRARLQQVNCHMWLWYSCWYCTSPPRRHSRSLNLMEQTQISLRSAFGNLAISLITLLSSMFIKAKTGKRLNGHSLHIRWSNLWFHLSLLQFSDGNREGGVLRLRGAIEIHQLHFWKLLQNPVR